MTMTTATTTETAKLTPQKVAGALKKAGYAQVARSDYSGTGFQVRTGYPFGVRVEYTAYRGSGNGPARKRKTAEMAQALMDAGFSVVLTEGQWSGLQLSVYATPANVPEKEREGCLTPEQVVKSADADERSAKREKLQRELARVDGEMEALTKIRDGIVAQLTALQSAEEGQDGV
jgi:hypothetical protein